MNIYKSNCDVLWSFSLLYAVLWHHLYMEPEYLTAEQVAEKLQMHPTIIRRMLARGILPGRKLGGKEWRVVASELREFMAQPAATPTAAASAKVRAKKAKAKGK
jgi:excisionase family DNA binding protein